MSLLGSGPGRARERRRGFEKVEPLIARPAVYVCMYVCVFILRLLLLFIIIMIIIVVVVWSVSLLYRCHLRAGGFRDQSRALCACTLLLYSNPNV